MASADRYAPTGKMLSVEQALAQLEPRLSPVAGSESVPLRAALGRILAEDVVAPIDVPGHDNSAMDGWAFAAADLPAEGEGRLPIAGRAAAGHPFPGILPAGAAIRILTGAAVPAGADTVAMQEICRVEGETLVVPAGQPRGAHIRRAGEDVSRGRAVLSAGCRLGAPQLGLAASVGCLSLPVRLPLRAAVFATGDEVRAPGQPLDPGCIYDSNRVVATALLEGLGCAVTDLGILPDQPDTIRAAISAAAADHDVILTSGGVSVGDEDHVRPAVEALGTLHFWRLAIKPGKPIALGEVNGKTFIGLPGNPVSGLVTFLLVARPVLLRLMGSHATACPRFPVVAGFSFRREPGRREWLRVRLEAGEGGLVARLHPNQGSGVLSSMAWAEGLLEVPEDRSGVAPGDVLPYLPFQGLLR